MSSIVNKVKEALHSDKSDKTDSHTHGHNTTTTGATGTHTTGTHNTTGLHGENRGLDGPATKTDGPHSGNISNKLDPRVDSDRDHSHNLGANPHGTATTGAGAHTGTHTGTSGLHSTTGTHNTHGVSEGTAGPHGSRAGNALDPRVDSDLDRSRNAGINPSGTATTGNHGPTGIEGGNPAIGAFGSSNTHGTHGTHGTTGLTGSHGTTGTHGTHGATGTHGTTGTHNTTGLTGSHAPGPAPNTAGPHKSDALNKVDPRVDSDLDGSKTVGGDKTYTR